MQAEMTTLEVHLATPEASDADLQRYGVLMDTFNARQGYAIPARIEATLFGLGFTPTDLQTPVQHLSGGQKNMGALARVLLQAPDLLLLDEPSNHLDIVATEWLEGLLRTYPGTVVAISHDRYFLDRTVTEIVELEFHTLRHYPGNYSAYMTAKTERLEQQRKAYEQQQAEVRRQEDFIRRNMAGQKTKQAQSRQKALERLERVEQPTADNRRMRLQFTATQRESHEVLICRQVHKAYGERQVLRGLSCTIYRGDKVGLMGPNGAGKSTFLRLLMGRDTPDDGTLRLGRQVTVAYYDQELRDLEPNRSVLDDVWQLTPGKTMGEMRSYLSRFLFSGADVFQTIDSLSGGQKSRVALAKLMLSQANLLVLDEPTNHLDIPAREALESALADYDGTLLVVSHDRYFLDRIITRLLYLRDGTCLTYPGNYSAYQAHQAAQAQSQDAVVSKPSQKASLSAPARRRTTRRRTPGSIERDISKVEAEIAKLQTEIEAQQAHNDWQQLATLTAQQGEAMTRLERLMEEWEDSMVSDEGEAR
jgi:ATP-binding cassette subfamily F protein 3